MTDSFLTPAGCLNNGRLLATYRVGAVLTTFWAVAGCVDAGVNSSNVPCTPGLSAACYSGPAGTMGVGTCRGGVTLCLERNGTAESRCLDEVLPTAEVCDQRDNDCDGLVDEDGACTSQNLASLRDEVGNLATLITDDRVGPASVAQRGGGAIFRCQPDEMPKDCAWRFLEKNAALYGFQDVRAELVPTGVQNEGQIAHVAFAQVLRLERGPVRYEGRGVTVHIYFQTVRRLSAFIAPRVAPPRDESVLMSAEAAAKRIEPGMLSMPIPELVIWIAPNANGTLDSPGKQKPRLAYRVDYTLPPTSDPWRAYVDALTGDVLSPNSLARAAKDFQVWAAGANQCNTMSPTPPMGAGAELDLACKVAPDYYDYLSSRLGLDSFDGAGALLKATVGVNNSGGCGPCAPPMGVGIIGCNTKGDIRICDGWASRDEIVHEFNHSLTAAQVDGGRGGLDDFMVEPEAVDHAVVEVFAELHGCWASNNGLPDAHCDWKHAGRDYSQLHTTSELVLGNPMAPAAVGNRLIPGHSLWYIADFLGPSRYNVLEHLILSAIRNLRPASTMADFAVEMEGACSAALAMNLPGLAEGDCQAVQRAFIRTHILDNCKAPGVPEVCDGIDNDCNGFIDEAAGVPRDYTMTQSCYSGPINTLGVGTCHSGSQSCLNPGRWTPCTGEVVPISPETDCDGCDENCDGAIDEGLVRDYLWDADGDKYPGKPMGPSTSMCPAPPVTHHCAAQPRIVAAPWVDANVAIDCDDGNPKVHPKAVDGPPGACDGIDNDCNQATDDGVDQNGVHCPCQFGMGKPCGSPVGECHEGHLDCVNGMVTNQCVGAQLPVPEICNGKDDDCDGDVDEFDANCMAAANGICATGKFVCMKDVNGVWQKLCAPGAKSVEVCNGLDDDCNGIVDDAIGAALWYRDADGDGHGDTRQAVWACQQPKGYVSISDDCNDADTTIHPGQPEKCMDGKDSDCDGMPQNGCGIMKGMLCGYSYAAGQLLDLRSTCLGHNPRLDCPAGFLRVKTGDPCCEAYICVADGAATCTGLPGEECDMAKIPTGMICGLGTPAPKINCGDQIRFPNAQKVCPPGFVAVGSTDALRRDNNGHDFLTCVATAGTALSSPVSYLCDVMPFGQFGVDEFSPPTWLYNCPGGGQVETNTCPPGCQYTQITQPFSCACP